MARYHGTVHDVFSDNALGGVRVIPIRGHILQLGIGIKIHDHRGQRMPLKQIIRITSIVAAIGLLIIFFGGSYRGLGSVMVLTAIMLWAYRFFLRGWANGFQEKNPSQMGKPL
jgi:PsbJ.